MRFQNVRRSDRTESLSAALAYVTDALAVLDRAGIFDDQYNAPAGHLTAALTALRSMTCDAPKADPKPAAFPCHVCKADMGSDRPSGVCSEACLRTGQGFPPAVDAIKAAPTANADPVPSVGSLINAYGAMGTDAGNAVAMALAAAIASPAPTAGDEPHPFDADPETVPTVSPEPIPATFAVDLSSAVATGDDATKREFVEALTAIAKASKPASEPAHDAHVVAFKALTPAQKRARGRKPATPKRVSKDSARKDSPPLIPVPAVDATKPAVPTGSLALLYTLQERSAYLPASVRAEAQAALATALAAFELAAETQGGWACDAPAA